MTQFIAHFKNSDGTDAPSHQFRLADTAVAQAWLAAVLSGVTHIASAGAPSDARKLRQWQIIRYHINQANEDHLLDEWIHFPLKIVEDFQPLLNSVRLRAHAYELYAAVNNQQSQTRTSLLRVIQAIDAFEDTVDPAGYRAYVRFQHSRVEFDAAEKTATVTPGTIVLTQPPPDRTAYQMYRANDTTLLTKHLIRPWISTMSNYSMVVLNRHVNTYDVDAMPLCADKYILNNTAPVATITDNTKLESISTHRIVKIQHEN